MGLYLKIENPGVAPPEAFTLFGATTKRYTQNPLIIGTFGSGNKHSTCLLLRESLNPVIFCGNLKLSFYTKPRNVVGVTGKATEHRQVCVRYGGKDAGGGSRSGEEELSVTLDYGTHDWHSMSLALREYVSNALDAYFEQFVQPDDYKDRAKLAAHVRAVRKAVKLEVVEENQVRAAKGGQTTRVFVPFTQQVQEWYGKLGTWFLHFSEPDNVVEPILGKRNRNQSETLRPVIYRRGVWVREITSTRLESLYDYNLADLQLNESRTFDDWNARYEIARQLSGADAVFLVPLFRALKERRLVWERCLEKYGLTCDLGTDAAEDERRKRNWQVAFEAVAGENGVLVTKEATGAVESAVVGKGFVPVVADEAPGLLEAAQTLGIKTDAVVLTEDDKAQRTFSEATPEVRAALDWCWDVLVRLDMTNGKEKPPCGCFYEPVREGSQTWGLYREGKCLIHTDIAGGDVEFLRVAMMEEVAHHVTGATDFSRDFQTFLVRLAVALARRS